MTLKEVKHQFMAMRNGIVSDTLRSAGMNYSIIFGLQLPQLSEIARMCGKDESLARELWKDTSVRESRLLAPFLINSSEMSIDEALAMATELKTREEADILAFKLLRFHPEVGEIHRLLSENPMKESSNKLSGYIVEALERFM